MVIIKKKIQLRIPNYQPTGPWGWPKAIDPKVIKRQQPLTSTIEWSSVDSVGWHLVFGALASFEHPESPLKDDQEGSSICYGPSIVSINGHLQILQKSQPSQLWFGKFRPCLNKCRVGGGDAYLGYLG